METLRYVVLVNGLLAVVSVAYYVLLRRETFFGANRIVLWLGLLGSLLLPLLELPDWRPQPVRTAMQQTAQAIVPRMLPPAASPAEVTITFPNHRTYRAFQTQQNGFSWSWPMGLLLLYALVVVGLMARLGIQLLSLRKLIRQSGHEPYDDFVLVCNETVTSPFSFFKWVVLNPAQHTTDELDQILRHERVHVRERHSIDMLAVELVCIVFWFNPAAYLFRHLIHQILEFSADRAVLAEGIDAKAYQYNLLKVSLSAGQSTLTNHFSKSQLKSRIVMLNQPNSSTVTWLKYPVLLLAALTVASAFARPKAEVVSSTPEAKPITRIAVLPKTLVKSVTKSTQLTTGYEPVAVKSTHSIASKSSGLSIESNSSSTTSDNSEPTNTRLGKFPLKTAQIETSGQLQNVTAPDLPTTAKTLDDKEMEAMVLEGQRKYGPLGIGPRRFDKEEIKSMGQSSPRSYLKVSPDGSLSVDETATYAKVFINNEPVSPQKVRSLTINHLYTLLVVYGYQPAGQDQVGTRYILFYTDQSK